MAKKKPDDAAAEAERRFKADLKAGTLGSFYIICGEEAFLRSHYVELATKKLTDGPAGEFNFHRFSADDCTPQALADAIDAMPMMAERTLVRVDDVDLFKQPEGAREQYAAILDFVATRTQELGDAMKAGIITPAPYRDGQRTPCSYCSYRSLCRHSYGDAPKWRKLKKIDKADFWESITPEQPTETE